MKTVWITKTGATAALPVSRNLQFITAPLLRVAPASQAPECPKLVDTVIFTSQNGVRSFCELTDLRDWPIYSVGDATGELAQKAGFRKVTSAGKDVRALRDLINDTPTLKSKRLYYASGQDVSGDLASNLKKDGYNIVRAVVYETNPITSVPNDIRKAMAGNQSFCVLLYSQRGAKAFRALDLDFDRIETISISENVDKTLSSLVLKSRKTAKKPTHDSMIKQLSETA